MLRHSCLPIFVASITVADFLDLMVFFFCKMIINHTKVYRVRPHKIYIEISELGFTALIWVWSIPIKDACLRKFRGTGILTKQSLKVLFLYSIDRKKCNYQSIINSKIKPPKFTIKRQDKLHVYLGKCGFIVFYFDIFVF